MHPSTCAHLLFALGTMAVVGACSSSSSPPPAATGDTGVTDLGTDAKKDGAPIEVGNESGATCDVCDTSLSGDPPAAEYVCVKTMDADVVDAADGKPVKDVTIMSCSNGLCVSDVTSAEGKVHLVPCHYMKQAAFKVFGFTDFVPFSIPIFNPPDTFTFTKVPLTRIPTTGLAIKTGESQTLTMGGLTLVTGTGPKNAVVDDFAPFKDFRAVMIPDGKAPKGLGNDHGLEIFWGLGPQNTTLEPPAQLTVPNSKAWSAGTAVEFWVHNYDLVSGLPVKFGEWWLGSTGTVSSDGKTISTDSGKGIPMLSLIGIRRKG